MRDLKHGRPVRSVGSSLTLWDVKNVEAHVRTTLDAALNDKGARLNSSQYRRAYEFMLSKCWELSGLEGDGVTLRYVWVVDGFYAPRGPSEGYAPIKLPEFAREHSAQLAIDGLRADRTVAFATVRQARPRGAYDPAFGLRFSTYSRGLLTKRLADWYRSDDDFGDNRYEGRQRREVSLEALAEQRRQDDGGNSLLEHHSPGARLAFVDELNPAAYRDALERFETDDTTLMSIERVEEVRRAAVGL